MTTLSIKRVPTLFLKSVLVVIGLAVLALVAFSFRTLWNDLLVAWEIPEVVRKTGIIGVYASAIPFLYALSRAFVLLQLIDRSDAFSESSVKALSDIKHCAIAMTVCYAFALPLSYMVAEIDDAPGLILIATAIAGAPLIVATFAAVLQKLIRSGVDLKTENELTV